MFGRTVHETSASQPQEADTGVNHGTELQRNDIQLLPKSSLAPLYGTCWNLNDRELFDRAKSRPGSWEAESAWRNALGYTTVTNDAVTMFPEQISALSHSSHPIHIYRYVLPPHLHP